MFIDQKQLESIFYHVLVIFNNYFREREVSVFFGKIKQLSPKKRHKFFKICEVTKILQNSLDPLKSVSGNLHRMNMLITHCNKQLDSLDLIISDYEGKRKEPPGFEHDSTKKLKIKDGTT